MNASVLRPFFSPLLLSSLLVASALLLWRVSAAEAAQTGSGSQSCVVLDNKLAHDTVTRRVETMLMLHRGW